MNDEFYMEKALEAAKEAAAEGEAPIGAVIVRNSDGEIVGCGRNCREACKTALGHAEIAAIEGACQTLGGWRLCGCTMYVTLEPCPMCAGAAINARLDRVVFGAYDKKNGSAGSVTDLFSVPFTHITAVTGGIKREECEKLLAEFFARLRKRDKMNNTVKLIPVMTDEQILAAAKIADEIWHEWFPPIIGLPQTDYMVNKFQSVSAITEQIRNGGYEYCFIHRAGIHIGYTAFHKQSDGKLFLSKIYILKEYRGNGYASSVINQLKDYCRANGLDRIWLTVNKHNDNSIAVYEKLGFKRFDSQKNDIGGGFAMDDYYYELKI